MSASRLPSDLEREIFEFAALSRATGIPTLMLVAWRVKTWVEPLLYRTIVVWPTHRFASMPERIDRQPIFRRQPLIQIMKSKPASFFQNAVRHVMISHLPEEDTEGQFILSTCPGIEDLWTYGIFPYMLPLMSSLRLKRLHCGLSDLLSSTATDFTHPLFANLTHLEVMDSPDQLQSELDKWAGIAQIPNLTHLAFNDMDFLPLWAIFLDRCPSLRLLASIVSGWARAWAKATEELADHPDGVTLMKDPRFLLIQCKEFERDWQMGAHTGEDFWVRADVFVAKRRSGEVVDTYIMMDDPSTT
ncbi:hypothetical protein C8R46DRAFT_1078109, partial [Mycena filopes]